MDEQIKEVAKTLALLVHQTIAWEESMDGDRTADLAKEFLKELDKLNGNI